MEKIYDEYDLSVIEHFCKYQCLRGERTSKRYKLMLATDYAVRSLDDRALQRLLRDVDNYDLAAAMRILSDDFNKKIFNNLSKRLAVYVAETMQIDIPDKRCVKGTKAIFRTLVELIEYGDIVSPAGEIFIMLGDFLKIHP